ncbi:citrate synthase-lysine N-methyltransferase CSKMT, mitochondrial isoform X3 [Mustela lutreola]|uniref:citrate synthase-lysine N-methyltransferase CSKMT, mitochondrial isoform X3 n=1 Tax=Mustela lutreola TaxID=9666 RepID=UPI002797B514|nr:citrate synthase-lysine N-methyltransferase CSKMT, mitochondrial isoform X3 [Mustela lutreola]
MYGGRGKGLWSPRRHVFGARGIPSAGSILKRRDTASEKRGGTEVLQAPPSCAHAFSFDFRSLEPPLEPEQSRPLFNCPLQTIKDDRTLIGLVPKHLLFACTGTQVSFPSQSCPEHPRHNGCTGAAASLTWLFTLVLEEDLGLLFLIGEQQQLVMWPAKLPAVFTHLRGFHHDGGQGGLLRDSLNRDSRALGPSGRRSQQPEHRVGKY